MKSCFLNLRIASGAVSWEARGEAAASILGKWAAVLELRPEPVPAVPATAVLISPPSPAPGDGKFIAAEHGFRLFEGGEAGAYILQTDPRAAESRVAWANCCKFLLAAGLLGPGGRRRFLLLHGALLEHSGSAAVLLAPGGTGKSTTLRRHRLHGGGGCADDWLLLCEDGEAFAAYPLPTWSEYGRLCDRRFPAEHGLPVRWLLVLSRSERGVGYAGAIPAAEWKAALLNSAEHASWQPLRLLPQETGRKIRLDNAALIGRLARSFFPLAYYADLNDIPGSVLDAVVSRRNR